MASMVSALASQLGVSHSAAQRAMNQLNALSDRNGVDPASPAFAAIAHQLGVTPARLAAALPTAKQAAGRFVAGH
jgi:UDP-N-acetylmuramyl pentapeptide synthase